jgi:hypothetical protein
METIYKVANLTAPVEHEFRSARTGSIINAYKNLVGETFWNASTWKTLNIKINRADTLRDNMN